MQVHKLYNNKQFGFISGRSTVLQLLKVLDRWTEILHEGGCIDVAYCDFMKAFDKVPHRRLLHKLQMYGRGENYIQWIGSFLLNRKQKVSVNQSESKPMILPLQLVILKPRSQGAITAKIPARCRFTSPAKFFIRAVVG